MLTIELRMVIIFWYLFLESHQTTYHSNIGVQLRQVNRIGKDSPYNEFTSPSSRLFCFDKVSGPKALSLILLGS